MLIGWQWTPELDRKIKQDWVDTLARLNYRRIVILRAAETDQINGLRVVEDRQVAQVSTMPGETGLASGEARQFTAR